MLLSEPAGSSSGKREMHSGTLPPKTRERYSSADDDVEAAAAWLLSPVAYAEACCWRLPGLDEYEDCMQVSQSWSERRGSKAASSTCPLDLYTWISACGIRRLEELCKGDKNHTMLHRVVVPQGLNSFLPLFWLISWPSIQLLPLIHFLADGMAFFFLNNHRFSFSV